MKKETKFIIIIICLKKTFDDRMGINTEQHILQVILFMHD